MLVVFMLPCDLCTLSRVYRQYYQAKGTEKFACLLGKRMVLLNGIKNRGRNP